MSASPYSNDMDSTFEPWSIKRTMILANYTTSEKLSITTVSCYLGNSVLYIFYVQSFLSDEDKVKC